MEAGTNAQQLGNESIKWYILQRDVTQAIQIMLLKKQQHKEMFSI